MKKLFILLLVPFLFSDCGKDDDLVLFSIPVNANFEIRAGLNTFETHIFEILNFESQLDSILAFNNLTRADINSIDPEVAEFQVLSAGGRYDFLQEVSIELFTLDNFGQDDVVKEVFWRPQVPNNSGTTLGVAGTLVNAQPFFEEDLFNIRVKLLVREITTQFITTRLRMNFIARRIE